MTTNYEHILVLIFGFCMIVFWFLCTLLEMRRTHEVVTPLTLLSILSVVDIYLPAILSTDASISRWPSWVIPASYDGILPALLYYSVSMVFLISGYLMAARSSRFRNSRIVVLEGRLTVLLVVSGLWYCLVLVHYWQQAGSFSAWLSQKGLIRWTGTAPVYRNVLEQFFVVVGEQMRSVFLFSVSVSFYSRPCSRSLFRGLLLPLLGGIVAATTFYRGTILSYFVSLAIVESFRSRDGCPTILRIKKPKNTRLVILVIALIMFVLYGALRNSYNRTLWTGTVTGFREGLLEELRRLTVGEGLMGLSSILASYPGTVPLFWGKTIFDMLLMPVPRVIWKSKPIWYGIDDITRAMGWPPSTQSAVTIPGELHANFGYFGIVAAGLFGWLIGQIWRLRLSQKFRFVYACTVVNVLTATHWMSFTGFISQTLGPFLFLGLATNLIIWVPGGRTERRNRTPLETLRGFRRDREVAD